MPMATAGRTGDKQAVRGNAEETELPVHPGIYHPSGEHPLSDDPG